MPDMLEAMEAAKNLEPQWDGEGAEHDWRSQVPLEVRGMWKLLDLRGRIAVTATAMEAADRDRWDNNG